MPTTTPCYDALVAGNGRIHRLGHLQAMASWDSRTNMPPAGAAARGAAQGEMAALLRELETDPQRGALLEAATGEPLDDDQQANLREMQRALRLQRAVPESIMRRSLEATTRCSQTWQRQRGSSGSSDPWRAFLVDFAPLVACVRSEAQALGDALGCGPYDALLERHEPGLRQATLAPVFNEVEAWLPGLVSEARQQQEDRRPAAPSGLFAIDAQQRLCKTVMTSLGFDFEAGRLDESAHPFTGGVPEDVRITGRFVADDFVPGLMSVMHETGHARYQQALPRRWLGQPVGEARSAAIHESQSLSFERQIGAHPAFIASLAPLLRGAFGARPECDPQWLQARLLFVEPGPIRVAADELTYPAHILLRWKIERALVEGEIEAADIPQLWQQGMKQLLDVTADGTGSEGALQDIHWASGYFGYFPSYLLGAMYAAQLFAAMRRDLGELDSQLRIGALHAPMQWLSERIWQAGSRWATDELVQRASGEALNPLHFRRHLQARYAGGTPLASAASAV